MDQTPHRLVTRRKNSCTRMITSRRGEYIFVSLMAFYKFLCYSEGMVCGGAAHETVVGHHHDSLAEASLLGEGDEHRTEAEAN
jgi:hypothetical protein